MRRLALAALLALAASACSVKTEGASCADGTNCPDGQACGHDGTCSKEAAGCGAICRADDCGGAGGAPRRCDAAANGVCASFATQPSCGADVCLISQGKAACVSLALTGPPNGTVVAGPGGPSTPVAAELTVSRADFPLPATLDLTADAAGAGTLARQTTSGAVTSYTGTYAPASGLEKTIELRAAAGTVVSPPRSVEVDTRAPDIAAPTAGCSPSPCLRDGLVDVAATVTDRNPGSVWAAVDLDYGATVLLAGTGTSYAGQVSLGARSFPGFSRTVTARVTATDAHGNVAQAQEVVVSGGEVTRARAAYAPGSNPVTSPAILPNGNAVVGIGSTLTPAAGATNQIRAMAPDGTEAWQQTLWVADGFGYPLNIAPAAGGHSLFAAGSDGRLYRIGLDGSIPASTYHNPIQANLSSNVGALVTPWVRTDGASDHAFSAGAVARLWQLWTDPVVGNAGTAHAVASSGVWAGAQVALVSSDGAAASLRRFTDVDTGTAEIAPALALTNSDATPTACDRVSVALAVDAAGFVVIACDNGQLHRVDPTATALAAGYLGPLGAPSGSPVVLAGGDYLVPLANGTIARVANPAAPVFSTFATLAAGDVARGLAVAAANATTGAPAAVYAATSNGRLYAFDATGTQLWAVTLSATGSALDFPTIAPAAAAPGALPTLLVGSGEGKLFRVVVDAPLDDSPGTWPKAHHDVRNTGNPATPVNGP